MMEMHSFKKNTASGEPVAGKTGRGNGKGAVLFSL